ncbi:MAG: hypothetical protein JWO05_3673 [Gemmatimonadetes bacterium]|nr:hypothetical protein [Gemmatimonadota bacterium]
MSHSLRLGPILVLLACTRAGAQQADTITLSGGAEHIDLSRFAPHVVAATQVVTKNGSVVRSSSFTNRWTVEDAGGAPAIRLTIDSPAGGPAASSFHYDFLFDRRTTLPLKATQRFGSGRAVDATMQGVRVTGLVQPERDAQPQPFDVSLESPSYLAGVVDFTLAAVRDWRGVVVRVPVFGLPSAQRHTQWLTFRATRTDSARVGGRMLRVTVIEGDGPSRDEIWLVNEPPYELAWIQHNADGSVTRLEQALVIDPAPAPDEPHGPRAHRNHRLAPCHRTAARPRPAAP